MKLTRTMICAQSLIVAGILLGSVVSAQTPSFTSFDAPDAGTSAGQGTFGGVINAKGVIATGYVDSKNGIHGLVRSAAGQLTEFDPPGMTGTLTLGINLRGQVVGYALSAKGRLTGFLRSATGTLKAINVPGATDNEPYGVNDSGVITGQYLTAALDGTHGFLLDSAGNFTFFDEPNAGTANNQGTFPIAINSSGAVVGSYIDSQNIRHGFVRDATGNFTSFDPPSAADTSPQAINAGGEVVGTYTEQGLATHSFLRDALGNITNIDVSGAAQTNADGLNDSGVIAGWVATGLRKSTAFTRDTSGNYRFISAPGSNLGTFATGINATGRVTGYWLDTSNVAHGFIQ